MRLTTQVFAAREWIIDYCFYVERISFEDGRFSVLLKVVPVAVGCTEPRPCIFGLR